MSISRAFTPSRCVIYLVFIFLALLCSYYRQTIYRPVPIEDDVHVAIPFTASGSDWSKYAFKNRLSESDFFRLPKGDGVKFPRIQHGFPSRIPTGPKKILTPQETKIAEIKTAFIKTWVSYEKHAWGQDEVKPLNLESSKSFNGWATFMIESLDTLWMMDMKAEFYRAATFVARMDFDNTTSGNFDLFETNVRHLGGLISAYELSQEDALLSKAVELGDLLYAAFDNPLHMPPQYIKFQDLKAGKELPEAKQNSGKLGSMALEFTKLSQLTGNAKYYDAIHRITRNFERTQLSTHITGLWPTEIGTHKSFDVSQKAFSLGGGGDTVYEYLLKEHVLLKGREPVYERMYNSSVEAIAKHLLFRPMLPEKDDVLMLGNIEFNWRRKQTFVPTLEHLTCSAGGMFAMGGKIFEKPEQIEIGEKLVRGCTYAYNAFPNGIMPEVAALEACPSLEPCDFQPTDDTTKPPGFLLKEHHYALRPEAIESLFMLYRITGKPEYQDMAWNMWKSVKNATDAADAFTTMGNSTQTETQTKPAAIDTYWAAQTFKYFWLIFANEDVMSLDKWVFNTEGHPFRR